MKKHKLVLAGTHRAFIAWCREEDFNPQTAIYADNPMKIRGLRPENVDIVYAYDWQNSPVINDPYFVWLAARRGQVPPFEGAGTEEPAAQEQEIPSISYRKIASFITGALFVAGILILIIFDIWCSYQVYKNHVMTVFIAVIAAVGIMTVAWYLSKERKK